MDKNYTISHGLSILEQLPRELVFMLFDYAIKSLPRMRKVNLVIDNQETISYRHLKLSRL